MGNVKPLSFLNNNRGKNVLVDLRNKKEYRGTLDGFDMHMNLVLKNAVEIKDEEELERHELVIVRGDNIILISP